MDHASCTTEPRQTIVDVVVACNTTMQSSATMEYNYSGSTKSQITIAVTICYLLLNTIHSKYQVSNQYACI